MELFTGNLEILKREIKQLGTRLKGATDKDEIVAIVSSIEILQEFYYDISSDKKYHSNIYTKFKEKCKTVNEIQNSQFKNFNENFIKNKEFHRLVINDTLFEVNKACDDLFSLEEGIVVSNERMYEIMTDYLAEKNLSNYLEEIIRKKLVFVGSSNFFFSGYTAFNTVYNIPHILIDKNNNSTDIMMAMIHEIGHVIDYFEMVKNSGFKTVNDYYMNTIYSEVISKKYEKDFLSYLLRNGIFSQDACCMVEDYYLDMQAHLGNLLILTYLDDNLLRDEKYQDKERKLKILENIDSKETSIEYIDKDLFEVSDLSISMNLFYAYGGMLANYFTYLEQVDKDKYDLYYNQFLQVRGKAFDTKDFASFVPDIDLLDQASAYLMKNDIKIKRKVYQEK